MKSKAKATRPDQCPKCASRLWTRRVPDHNGEAVVAITCFMCGATVGFADEFRSISRVDAVEVA